MCFAILAILVSKGLTLGVDSSILLGIRSVAHPVLDHFFIVITHVGDSAVVLGLTALMVGYCIYKKQRRNAATILLLVGGSIAINILFKLIFHRARPELWEHLLYETGYSFPSGHSMLGGSLLVSIVMTTWRTRGKWIILAMAAVLVFLGGLSRLYIGVHYPSDILAGWSIVLALAFALAAVRAATPPLQKKK